MPSHHPCGTLRRRDFLAAAAALPVLGGFRHASAAMPQAAADPGLAGPSASPARSPAG